MEQASSRPTVPGLIDTWEGALGDVIALCEPLTDEQWHAPTPCPGWSVADVVAHLVDVEEIVGGEPRPQHVPDYDALPHAQGDFGRLTEIGVDVRRGRPQPEVLDELRAAITRRRAQLDALPADAEVMGPMGGVIPLERLLRMRIFDSWVHEQDIRTATGIDGDWGTAAARIAGQQMTGAIPFAWGRNVKAPAGSAVRVMVTGPGIVADVSAVVGEDGRGRAVDTAGSPAVTLTASWPDFMRLACGRIDTTDAGIRSRIVLSGDAQLGEALLRGLSIAP